MHDQHSSGRPARSRRDDRDPQVAYDEEQAYVLDELLDEYPALMTYEEARLARVTDPGDWVKPTGSKSQSARSAGRD